MVVVIDRKIVLTRKNHNCFGCLASIPAGSSAVRSTNVYEGKIYTIYLCEDCNEFCGTLPDGYWAHEGYYEGDLIEAKLQEGWKAGAKT